MENSGNHQKSSRRNFVKNASLALGGIAALSPIKAIAVEPLAVKGKRLVIEPNPGSGYLEPLQTVHVMGADKGIITVHDGAGNMYHRQNVHDKLSFKVAGVIGTHFIVLEGDKGELLDTASFKVDCKTEIKDKDNKYQHLLDTLYQTMIGEYKRQAQPFRLNGKMYFAFVSWLRDHVHTMKGMKYFYPELKSGIDMYADYQREDGMIWDNIYTRDQEKNWWDKRFSYGNFILPVENETYEFHRIPVEADVEYLFIEGIYYTWKATGDNAWMGSRLNNALKAVKYVTTSPYRWSDKYQLVKRGFTIDTWDFQAYEDTLVVGGDIMVIDKDKSRFGIMFGDNTGMAASCNYLAEMLDVAGRAKEAAEMRQLADGLLKRLNALAWNGNHFTHHIPEDTNVKRDLGVDQSKQVSLSNSYSLNRGITHEQIVAIIKTYQQIKKEMPVSSPGEWYSIYPPFAKGFGIKDASGVWDYMNGGVTPIVGGELAHGAFEHGFETYGVDILDRIAALAAQTDDYLHCTYRGAMPNDPVRELTPVSIKHVANINYPGKDYTFKNDWIGQTVDNAASAIKTYFGIPFEILNPGAHKTTCIEVNDTENNLAKAVLPINRKAASVYLLHTMTPGKFAGTVNFYYTDGTTTADYITEEKIGHWWRNTNEAYPKLSPNCKKAWRSDNDKYVAFYIYGVNNPQPDKVLQKIEFEGAKQAQKWQVLAVTLSDYQVFFPPSKVSYGIPDNWGSAAVVYALLEGLAGVKDAGIAFNKALLAPRWEAAGLKAVSATVKYEASGGYVSYQYKLCNDKNCLELTFTGSALQTTVEILLPAGREAKAVVLNNKGVPFKKKQVEQSRYVTLQVDGIAAHQLKIQLA